MSAKHQLDIRRHPDYIDPTTVAEKNSALAERIMETAKVAAVEAMTRARESGAHSLTLPEIGIKAFEANLPKGVMRYGDDAKHNAWWRRMNEWLDAADAAAARREAK